MINVHNQHAIDRYIQPKPKQDIDLIVEVRQLLLAAGLGQHLPFYDNDRFIKEAIGKESSVQQYLLNRYWTNQLLNASKVSIKERYSLIPDGIPQDWLELFKAEVLPFVVENGLPCAEAA